MYTDGRDQPAQLPWHLIETSSWDPACNFAFEAGQDPTVFYQQWASQFEDAFAQQVHLQGHSRVPPRCFGRAKRLQPIKQELTTPTCKPSREREVRIANSMAGTATRIWFKQLRRLQSLKHPVAPAAAKPPPQQWLTDLNFGMRSEDLQAFHQMLQLGGENKHMKLKGYLALCL